MRDFADEVPGYLRNAAIRRALEELEIYPGAEHIESNMIRCYQRLIAMEVVGVAELGLLQHWLHDLAHIAGKPSADAH